MTETAAQQPQPEPRYEPRVLKDPSWMLAENVFGGIGAGVVAYCWPRVTGDTWGDPYIATAIAGVAGGGLCLIRFGIDEIALLLRVTFTQALIAYRRVGEWGGKRRLKHDIRIAFNYADRMERENAQLRAKVSLLEKKRPSGRVSEATWDPDAPDETQDFFDEWMRQHEAPQAEERDEPVAPTLELDESVEACFEAAGELLNHYEQFGSLAKGNAYQNSGITNRQWDKAKQILLDAGAARMDGNSLTLAVPTALEADVMLDRYREQLATQLHG